MSQEVNSEREENSGQSVGYKNPPADKRFKKGNKAAAGRGKKAKSKKPPKDPYEHLLDVMLGEITIKKNGKPQQLPLLSAVMETTAQLALSGSMKDKILLLNWLEKQGLSNIISMEVDARVKLSELQKREKNFDKEVEKQLEIIRFEFFDWMFSLECIGEETVKASRAQL